MTAAHTLVEALPYIKAHRGRMLVVKYGGHAMSDPQAMRSFVGDVVLMHYVGIHPVVVHGGGPQISDLMARLNQSPQFVDGHRITGPDELDVVRMVLGKTNKEIVALANEHGDLAVGISGEDANLIRARKLLSQAGDDLGLVGEVERVDPRVIMELVGSGFIPVISPIGLGEKGQAYNINADLVAGALATALHASKLIYLTDVAGLYEDFGDEGTLLSRVTAAELEGMLDRNSLSDGMIPKVTSCIQALAGGVERVHFLDGRVQHALLLELFTDSGVGTMAA